MDPYEATRVVHSRIQNLDPENASKIMGLLLIQDHGDKEMIRLAFGPEALLHSVVLKARRDLGLAPNSPSTPLSPPSPPPFNHRPPSLSRQNSSFSRLLGGGVGTNLPSPLSIPNQSSSFSSSWDASSCFSDFQNPDTLISPNSSSLPFYGSGGTDLIDEFQLQDQLSFLNDGSLTPGHKTPDGTGGDATLFSSSASYRRSCSVVSDMCLGFDDPACGFGWKTCLYYARGYCKNGNSCRFLHGGGVVGLDGGAAMVGSPSKLEMVEEFQEQLRSKSGQQQRLAAASHQLVASSTFPYSVSATNKYMNLLLQQQQSDSQRAAAALMMGEETHKFGRFRNEFPMNGETGMSSRQIYLTFPADSTFREEDVSDYFSVYGPVQDVRIPYQHKRMFGFVTFFFPETVTLILAKGNPHFVCDARVLVKPYKEKGKVPDKYRKLQQQMERGELSVCSSPTGLDSRDPFDLQLGAKMFGDTQDIMWRRKLEEQAEVQQAIELHGQRLLGLQLLDVKRPHYHHRTCPTGGVATVLPSSTTHSPNFVNQTVVYQLDHSNPEAIKETGSNPAMEAPESVAADQQPQPIANVTEKEKEKEKEGKPSIANGTDENGNGKESPQQHADLPESLEHNLPDSPFASPEAAADTLTAFCNSTSGEAEKNAVVSAASAAASNLMITSSLLPATSTLDMASFKLCYLQVPRYSSSHGAIGM